MHPDLLIIGGGIIGLTVAQEALGRGLHVCLLEAGAVGKGTTAAAAGMLCPGFELPHVAPANQPEFHQFAMESLSHWKWLTEELEKNGDGPADLRLDGAIGLAADDAHAVRLGQLAGLLERLGRPVQRIDRAAIDALEPGLPPHVETGIWLPDEGQIDPRLAASALARAVRRRGGTIIEHEAVASLQLDKGGVTGVVTAAGKKYSAGTTVIAAGLAARDLWQETGPAPFFAIKGQALALALGGAAPRRVIRTDRTYVCPKAGGRIVIGATEEADVETLETDPAHIDALRRAAEAVVPVLASAQLTESWAGLRPTTPDRLPVIGHSQRLHRLVYAAGHHRNGILLAPATAALVCDIVTGSTATALFGPGRFETAA